MGLRIPIVFSGCSLGELESAILYITISGKITHRSFQQGQEAKRQKLPSLAPSCSRRKANNAGEMCWERTVTHAVTCKPLSPKPLLNAAPGKRLCPSGHMVSTVPFFRSFRTLFPDGAQGYAGWFCVLSPRDPPLLSPHNSSWKLSERLLFFRV